MIKAGAAQVEITPVLGTLINGDFVSQYARFIHDPLYAKALVLQNNALTIAIAVVDICLMDKEFVDEVKGRVVLQTGIPSSHILISATHTHAAGSVTDVLLGAADLSYRKRLPALIAQAIERAHQKLAPAAIGFGSVDAPEHVLCRRYFMKEGFVAPNPATGDCDQVKTNPFGNEHLIDRPVEKMDTELSFLAVKGADGQWISVVANYSLHYVGDWESGTISADYFGVFAAEVAKGIKANKEFICMMSNGTSGDANIWDFLHPDRYPKEFFKKSEIISSDLGEKVVQALNGIEWQTHPSLAVLYTELPLRIRKPSRVQLEEAKEIVMQTDFSCFSINDDKAIEKLYAREQLLLNEYPDEINLPIQLFKIGNGIIGALSAEFFAETGLRLKEGSPAKHYFTITLANGFFGYIPPAHEMERGGYETWRSRNSRIEEGGEEKVVNALLQQMQAIYELVK